MKSENKVMLIAIGLFPLFDYMLRPEPGQKSAASGELLVVGVAVLLGLEQVRARVGAPPSRRNNDCR